MEKNSVLKRIITETLQSHPDEAHQKILAYLSDHGRMDEKQALQFKQAWSKVVLGSEAFNRRNSSSHKFIDPSIFADELVNEICSGDKYLAKLQKIKLSAGSSSGSSSSIHATLHQLNELIDNIAMISKETYTYTDVEGPYTNIDDINKFESVAIFRQAIKGAKLKWAPSHSREKGVEYQPIDVVLHGQPEAFLGELELPGTKGVHTVPTHLSSTLIRGVRVSSHQPLQQERAWNTYIGLQEMICTGRLNMFPTPVGATRDSSDMSSVFALERVTCTRFDSHLSASLSTALRRHPRVLEVWCLQLSSAFRALSCCQSCRLSKPISNRDVFIREDGLLLLGNVAFECPGMYEEGEGIEYTPLYTLDQIFADTILRVITSALALSRTEIVAMQFEEEDDSAPCPSSYEDFDDEQTTIQTDNYESRRDAQTGGGETHTAGLVDKPGEHKIIYTVAAGCELQLLFNGHQSACVCVSVHGDDKSRSNTHSTRYNNSTTSSSMERMDRGLAALASSGAHDEQLWNEIKSNNLLYVQVKNHGRGATDKVAHVKAVVAHTKASHTVDGHSIAPPSSSPSSFSSSQIGLRIRGLTEGVISLTCTTYIPQPPITAIAGPGDRRGKGPKKKTRTVYVVIAPHIPAKTVELQELIGLAEESETASNARIILNARYLRKFFESGSGIQGGGTRDRMGELSGMGYSSGYDGYGAAKEVVFVGMNTGPHDPKDLESTDSKLYDLAHEWIKVVEFLAKVGSNLANVATYFKL